MEFGPDITGHNVSPQPENPFSSLSMLKYFSLVSSQSGDLYQFGGSSQYPHILRRINLDTQKSVAIVRNINAAGDAPSSQSRHKAVMIGKSLMVILGGCDSSGNLADATVYILNTGKLVCMFSNSEEVVLRLDRKMFGYKLRISGQL